MYILKIYLFNKFHFSSRTKLYKVENWTISFFKFNVFQNYFYSYNLKNFSTHYFKESMKIIRIFNPINL